MIPLPNVPIKPLMKSSLRPISLPNSLYWACWVWVHSHLQWMTPQIRTLQLAPSVGSCLCDDECYSLLRQGQTPKEGRWWPIYWAANRELPRGSQLNGRLAPCAWPSSPLGARRPENSQAAPFRPRWRKTAARFCVPFIPKTSRHLIAAQLLAPLSTNSL